MQHRLTMGEGPPFGVLPAHPHRWPFHQERRERQRLGVSPIDLTAWAKGRVLHLGERSAPPLYLTRELRQRTEIRRPRK